MMKKSVCIALSLLVVLVCFLSGCDKGSGEFSMDYSTDMQLMYLCSGGSVGVPMTKSDTGYYYIGKGVRDKRIVIYIDKESKKATPLCSKPNCMHDDIDECDAYVNSSETVAVDTIFGATGNLIQYYDGSLYLLCGEYDESYINYNTYIMKMNLDGTDREKITDYFDFHVNYWFIHRGHLYYCTDSQLLRVPMGSLKSEPEIVYEAEHFITDNYTFSNAFAYQNYVYCETDERDETVTNGGLRNHAINIETLEKSALEINGKPAGPEAFFGDKIIIANADNEGKYYEIADLDGGNSKPYFTQNTNEKTSMTSDGTYLYKDNQAIALKTDDGEQIITVMDKDLNEIDTFRLPQLDMKIYSFFAPQDEEFFIFECFNENDEHIIVMADKSQIGSINGEVIEYTELCKLKWAKNNSNGIYYTE